LHAEGARITVYDPISMPRAQEEKLLPPDVRYAENAYACAEGADVLIIMTEWNEFKLLNYEKIHESMRQPLIIDGRNIHSPERMRSLGFEYVSIGRGTNTKRPTHMTVAAK